MSDDKRLDIPPELQHLIEKRQLQDRRKNRRGGEPCRRASDLDRLEIRDPGADQESPVDVDPRFTKEGRKNGEHPQTEGRHEDDEPSVD